MVIELESCVPQELAVDAGLDELLEAIRAVETWTDRAARVLSYVYRHRVQRLLSSPPATGEEEELIRVIRHLRKAAHPSREEALNALDRPYAEVWRGYADLLESRIQVLRARDDSAVRKMAWVEDILSALMRGELNQSELGRRFGLKPANLSRILGAMEANELVVRRRQGRAKKVALHPKEAARRKEAAPTHQPSVPRGLDVFAGAKW